MVSDRERGPELGRVTTRLSLVVDLVDGFTGGSPVGDPRVRIPGMNAEPIHTPSGYRVFTDLDGTPVTVVVDGEERYFTERREDVPTIDLSEQATDVDLDDLPFLRIELAPTPSYRFPSGTTLLRGTIRDASGTPVTGADVSVGGRAEQTRTDEDGEFALFFTGVTEDDVTATDGRRLIKVDGQDPEINVDHPTLGHTSQRVEVEEGTLTVRDVAYSE